jgi:hypothetical protein
MAKTLKQRHRLKRHTIKKLEKLEKIYQGESGYLDTGHYNKKFVYTYGEMTWKGIQTMYSIFHQIHPISQYPLHRRVFYDLGSGIGKLVLGMAELGVHSKGIEMIEERNQIACHAKSKLPQSVQQRIELTCGSFLDHSIQDAGWIFISNLCFPEKVNKELADKLDEETQSKTLILCSKEMPFHQFILKAKKMLEMTWSNQSQVFLYEKK